MKKKSVLIFILIVTISVIISLFIVEMLRRIIGLNGKNRKLLYYLFYFVVYGVLLHIWVNSISKQAKKDYQFYNSPTRYLWDYEKIKQFLDEGADPDYCKGEYGWTDHNPLMVLTDGPHFTYGDNDNKDYTEEVDYAAIKLLYEYGADFNKYPYVWERVFSWANEDYLDVYKKQPLGISEEKKRKATYVEDCNRIVRALLECGADPNYKGHPYPFSYKAVIRERMTGEQAIEYFNSPEATTPLYEAIKKGMMWESQVDMLLEYGATLDESCLEAARLSGDEAMIEKVERLMKP